VNWHLLLQSLVDAVSLGSLFALFALGVALIFGVMQLINFAHGELVMIGGYVLVLAVSHNWAVVVAVTVLAAVIFALGMDRLAFRPVRGSSPATMLVTSFALSYMLQNLAMLIFGSRPKSASLWPSLSESFTIGFLRVGRLSVITVAVTVVLLLVLWRFLKMRIGVQMRAAAEDFQTARILGVRANTVIAAAFAWSGLLAATASILLVTQTGLAAPDMGVNVILVSFVAAVLGGMGSLPGAVLGGYLFGIMSVLLQTYLPLELRYYRDAFAYAAVIAILLVRPQGLIVMRTTRARV
jgi:branched-chain amino acid transport system permease protein